MQVRPRVSNCRCARRRILRSWISERDIALRVTISRLSQLLSNQPWKETYVRDVTRKSQSMLDTNELSQWHSVFDNMNIRWWKNGSVNLHKKSARIAKCIIFSKSDANQSSSWTSRGVFWWPYGKYRNPKLRIWKKYVMTCVLCIHMY